MLRTFGNPDATPLVLLHGLRFDGRMWDRWCETLQNDFYLLVPDLPGYDSAQEQKSIAIAEDVQSVLSKLPESACYLGWSLGGLFALWIATHHAHRARCAISLNATPCFAAGKQWSSGINMEQFATFRSILTTGEERTITRRIAALAVRGDQSPMHWQKIMRPLMCVTHRDTLQSGLDILWNTDIRKALQHSKVPIMHLLGDSDAMLSPTLASALCDLVPHQKVALMGDTGHALPWSRESHAISMVRQFIFKHGA